jgi:hypothetical protein
MWQNQYTGPWILRWQSTEIISFNCLQNMTILESVFRTKRTTEGHTVQTDYTDYSILTKKALCAFEMPGPIYPTPQRHTAEDINLLQDRCENLQWNRNMHVVNTHPTHVITPNSVWASWRWATNARNMQRNWLPINKPRKMYQVGVGSLCTMMHGRQNIRRLQYFRNFFIKPNSGIVTGAKKLK